MTLDCNKIDQAVLALLYLGLHDGDLRESFRARCRWSRRLGLLIPRSVIGTSTAWSWIGSRCSCWWAQHRNGLADRRLAAVMLASEQVFDASQATEA